MKLKQWVNHIGGPLNASKILDVSLRSVNQWLQGRNPPKDEVKVKIHRASKGQVQYAEMVEIVCKNKYINKKPSRVKTHEITGS